MEISSSHPARPYPLRPLQRSEASPRVEEHGKLSTELRPQRAATLAEYVAEGEHLQRDSVDYVDAIRHARLQQATLQQGTTTPEQPASYQARLALSAYGNNGPDDGVELLPRIDSYV